MALHTLPADATKPKHNDDDDNGNSNDDNVVNSLPQQLQPVPQSMGTSPNGGDGDSDIAGSGEFTIQQIQ